MQYRRTPLTFGLSPSELLNGRQIRTKLDALWPEPAHMAQGKQAAQVAKSQQREVTHPIQRYKVGVPCYAQYFGPRRNRQPRWVPAVVTKVCGTRNINVRVVPHGPTWRRHIEQLRPRYGSMEDTDPGEVPPTFQKPEAPDGPALEVPGDRLRRPNPKWPSDERYGKENPRRSERIRKRAAGKK